MEGKGGGGFKSTVLLNKTLMFNKLKININTHVKNTIVLSLVYRSKRETVKYERKYHKEHDYHNNNKKELL